MRTGEKRETHRVRLMPLIDLPLFDLFFASLSPLQLALASVPLMLAYRTGQPLICIGALPLATIRYYWLKSWFSEIISSFRSPRQALSEEEGAQSKAAGGKRDEKGEGKRDAKKGGKAVEKGGNSGENAKAKGQSEEEGRDEQVEVGESIRVTGAGTNATMRREKRGEEWKGESKRAEETAPTQSKEKARDRAAEPGAETVDEERRAQQRPGSEGEAIEGIRTKASERSADRTPALAATDRPDLGWRGGNEEAKRDAKAKVKMGVTAKAKGREETLRQSGADRSLPRGARPIKIVGRLLASDGSPLAFTRFRVYAGALKLGESLTDGSGEYAFYCFPPGGTEALTLVPEGSNAQLVVGLVW